MRVLVNGGTGFLGSHTVAALVDGDTMFTTLRAATGRRLPHITLPAAMILPIVWAASAAQRVVPFHLPAEYEAVLITGYGTRFDDSRARQELGIEPRPLAETYRDTVRWLYRAGHLSARRAGTLAQPS